MAGTARTEAGTETSGYGRGTAAGAIVALVLGSLLAIIGIAGIAGGLTASTISARQGPDGYISSPTRVFSTASYALASPPARIGTDKVPFDLGSVRLSATSTKPGGQVFIGVGPKREVDRYLSGVNISEVAGVESSPFRVQQRDVPGTAAATPPGEEGFWVEFASGSGTQEITMDLRSGNWVVVVMNSDAGAGVSVNLQAAVRSSLLATVPPALWIGGLAMLFLGAGLVSLGAIVLGRRVAPPAQSGGNAFTAAPGVYPASLTGRLDAPLSRGLWLVKWLLAVPHFIILFFLWFAVAITTIIAGFAILFTGRYPRTLFDFVVGVLRWTWRVLFYSYGALATDKYPPFTLTSTNYPADFDVEYPQHLSRWLVLVKGWLLAIPHLIVVGIFTGTMWWSWPGRESWLSSNGRTAGLSLLGILVLVAAVVVMFTGRYPRTIFELAMGINRWTYRVATYILLLRDEYPPFRMDQGPLEPADPLLPADGKNVTNPQARQQ